MSRLGRTALLAVLVACGARTTLLEDELLTVGCGTCQFKQTGYPGCYWAAEIEGRTVPMVGDGLPPDHDSHGPEGMCMVQRQARVTGTLEAERIVVTELELLPVAEGGATPAQPHVHAH